MKPRTTLLLLGAFLALLAYVYLGELRRPAPSPATATPAPLLLSFPADQVVAITVRGAGKETRLSRPAGGEWQLEAPAPGPADTARVGQLLNRLANLSPTRTLAEPGPLEEYGLDQPALEVTLALAGGSTQVLAIGAENPQQTAYYARVQGQEGVHLISSLIGQSIREMLDTPPLPPTPTPAPTATG